MSCLQSRSCRRPWSSRFADKEIEEKRMQPFAWFWSQSRAEEDMEAEEDEMEEQAPQ